MAFECDERIAQREVVACLAPVAQGQSECSEQYIVDAAVIGGRRA